MRLAHFEALRPVCPRCAGAGHQVAPSFPKIFSETGGRILMGIVQCPDCGQEYPIIDGLPLLVPSVQSYISQASSLLMARGDLPEELESLCGDAAGAGNALDSLRQHLSSYGWDHWGYRDPAEIPTPDAAPGAIARCLQEGLAILPRPPRGPALDIGCGPGRSTVELAAATAGPVLGVDLSFPLIRLAARILQSGRLSYPRRRIGMVYDRRDFAVTLDEPERLDFWVCDALAMSFRDGTFSLVNGRSSALCRRALPCHRTAAPALGGGAGGVRPVGFDVGQLSQKEYRLNLPKMPRKG